MFAYLLVDRSYKRNQSHRDSISIRRVGIYGCFSAFLWPPVVMGMPLYFAAVVSIYLSIYLSIFLFSSPILSGRRFYVYHTSTHDVALVRIWNAGLKSAARGSLKKIQDAKIAKK